MIVLGKKKKKSVEMPGIEPGASHMRSERSTTELHPQHVHIFPTNVIFIPKVPTEATHKLNE